MRDLIGLRSTQHLELAMCIDRLLPLALALVDVDQLLECGLGNRGTVVELGEQLLGTVVEARTEIVFGEREERLMSLRVVQVRPCEQILMNANCSLDFAA